MSRIACRFGGAVRILGMPSAWGRSAPVTHMAQPLAAAPSILRRAALRRMPGVTAPSPEGAFYVFPKIDGLTDSFAFCWKLLQETRVGVAPGVAFGAGGEGSVRICYAAERAILEPAMERLAGFLSRSWS